MDTLADGCVVKTFDESSLVNERQFLDSVALSSAESVELVAVNHRDVRFVSWQDIWERDVDDIAHDEESLPATSELPDDVEQERMFLQHEAEVVMHGEIDGSGGAG